MQKEMLEDIPHSFDQYIMKEHHMAHYICEGWGGDGRSGWCSACDPSLLVLPDDSYRSGASIRFTSHR